MDLNAENINKMIVQPGSYYLNLKKGSNKKIGYLNSLLHTFDLNSIGNFKQDMDIAIKYLQKMVMNQPQIIRCLNIKNNFINLDSQYVKLNDIFNNFNLNKYDTLFESIPEIFNGDYENTIHMLKEYVGEVNHCIEFYSQTIANCIKLEFDSNVNASLFNSVDSWLIQNHIKSKILENKEKDFVKIFDVKNYNDIDLVNLISKEVLGVKITDWNKDNKEELLNQIKAIKRDALKRTSIGENTKDFQFGYPSVKISKVGELLKNNIEDVFEEFGDAVSNEEKISVLNNLIKDLLG